MSKFIEYYLEFKKEMNVKNIQNVIKTAKQHIDLKKNKDIKDLIEKIENHKNRYSLDNEISCLIELIVKHDFVASFFAKEAGRQNASEKAQLKFLKERGIILENLPNSKTTGKSIKGVAKTLDFKSIKYPNRYFIAKVCMGNGGSQDGTFNEVRDALKNAILGEGEELYALIDGTRFHETAIKELEKLETTTIKITNCDKYTE